MAKNKSTKKVEYKKAPKKTTTKAPTKSSKKKTASQSQSVKKAGKTFCGCSEQTIADIGESGSYITLHLFLVFTAMVIGASLVPRQGLQDTIDGYFLFVYLFLGQVIALLLYPFLYGSFRCRTSNYLLARFAASGVTALVGFLIFFSGFPEFVASIFTQ